MLNVGHNNYVNIEKVTAITNATSDPIVKLIQRAREEGRLVDCTQGRKRKSIVVMDSGTIIVSSVDTPTLMKRFMDAKKAFRM